MNNNKFGYLGGTFNDEEIQRSLTKHQPLTLDLSIPSECHNSCFYCGYYQVNKENKISFNSIKKIIEQFSDLGGKSVKILGEGEPLLREDILEILHTINLNAMTPVLFTCGDVIGNNSISKAIHKMSNLKLVEVLNNLNCTLVLKFEALYQDDIVGRIGYSEIRNQALEILIKSGFNKESPTRLGFGIVLLKENFIQIPDIYKFTLKNNIYPLICPLMPIGKCKSQKFREKISPNKSCIEDLKKTLKREREQQNICFNQESDFPGGLPCDISRCGFYIDDIGDVLICESDENIGNIKQNNLNKLWPIVDIIKDNKYGDSRKKGLCFPKRNAGILGDINE